MPTNVAVPPLGESVSEAKLLKWHKKDGERVSADEPLCELETEKANVDVPSPVAGVLMRPIPEGTTVRIGETIATIDENAKASASAPSAPPPRIPPKKEEPKAPPKPEKKESDDLSPAVRRMVEENKVDVATVTGTGPGGRILKEDVIRTLDDQKQPQRSHPDTDSAAATPVLVPETVSRAGVRREPMSKIRKKIAERLVSAQHTAAILTTFNEIDLGNVMEMRSRYKEKFEKLHGVGLGFMSFFAKACVIALKEFPKVNAQIDGEDIVYHDYVHLGIAVSTERGLAVPVLRNAQTMGFAKIESEIKRLAAATKDGKLSLEELSGGTFTITNGGVFGSLLSTPILNPPQSAILGMHAIQKRVVVVNDEMKIRPMMYVALSYDDRLIDGRESVSFLVRLKELLEDPSRLLLGV